MKKKNQKIQFGRLQIVIAMFLVLIAVLYFVQRNVSYSAREKMILPLSESEFGHAEVDTDADVLILWEEDANGVKGRDLMEDILQQMRIPYELCGGKEFSGEMLEGYSSVLLSITHYNLLDEGILDILDWVKAGGSLMIVYPPEVNGSFTLVQDELGIYDVGGTMAVVEGLHFNIPFMIGSERKDYKITDPYESSLTVSLNSDCMVYIRSGKEGGIPVLWSRSLGQGTVVFNNLGFLEKAYRGIYCASFSLLEPVCAWPVINGSTFYIDDFPSPVPGGSSEYIQAEYGMDIKDFYTQVWWNDMYNLADRYGVRYTGLVIEAYSDQVQGPFDRNDDQRRYQYFGNMLLDQGGEIGFHGYNHMPLCLNNFNFGGQYDSYRHWNCREDMAASIRELNEFCSSLFPKEQFQVYVPPSNILSEEGRRLLAEDFPQIKAIASVYLPGGLAYEQEFEVSEDGIIETPRIISGYLLDDYMQLASMAELNFHFVNTHFQHPDDVLDEDRGAALGWPELHRRISEFMGWLYGAAPEIRNLTGTELAGAVQRYDALKVGRKQEEGSLKLTLDGFADEAWLFVRVNEGKPGKVEGGSMSQVSEGLYLLRADASQVKIELE